MADFTVNSATREKSGGKRQIAGRRRPMGTPRVEVLELHMLTSFLLIRFFTFAYCFSYTVLRTIICLNFCLGGRKVAGHTRGDHWNGFVTGFNIRLTKIYDLLFNSDTNGFLKHGELTV